jgi:hypothetical protein
LASVKDTDDDDDDVNDGGGGIRQRGRWDPVVVVVAVDDDNDNDDDRIVEAEQQGMTAKDVVSPTLTSATRFVIRRFFHLAIINTFAAGRRPLSPTFFASRCPIHHLRCSRRWLVVAFSAHPAAY